MYIDEESPHVPPDFDGNSLPWLRDVERINIQNPWLIMVSIG